MSMYQEKYISASDGLRLYVRDYMPNSAPKRTIVCLCGLTRNSKDFDEVAEKYYLKGHRVVTMDYRGRGLSQYDENWENYNPNMYGSDVFAVCTALGLHECIFIGTSLGGLLSMGLCTLVPTLVHSVVLNDVGPVLGNKAIDVIIEYTGDDRKVPTLEAAVEKLKSYYKDDTHRSEDEWKKQAQNTYKLEDGQYVPDWDVRIAQYLKTSASQDGAQNLWPFFKALADRPVLVLRGEVSTVLSQETYEEMLAALPNISGALIPNAGHVPTLSEPESQKALDDFIG
jgi:pimeloyl-ACP methyl ester carboxylesterase